MLCKEQQAANKIMWILITLVCLTALFKRWIQQTDRKESEMILFIQNENMEKEIVQSSIIIWMPESFSID